ncbi:SIS domain-containing protein [Glycomyces harbinensis]|uniref:6-phospho-3-hexuloisomerase n=1 Tax=Glycomyces harbinensis TaxID=58114 RepID=A0A1G6UCN3_9ACTN|nr:SIS domain-containing protein [Glycomyces harbinensis]SDD38335.1 6-phospho-3-hexuloisomerase [Glycomyces harbinensis]
MTGHDGAGIVASAKRALSEIEAVLAAADTTGLALLAAAVDGAPRVFVAGGGRSLLMMRAVAMRLMHIGLDVHVVGDTTAPAVRSGDLVVVASARGGRSALAVAEAARASGAKVAAVTASDEAFGDAADLLVRLPARTQVPSSQHAGSLFEQSLLVVGDALTRSVQVSRQVPSAALDARHANL